MISTEHQIFRKFRVSDEAKIRIEQILKKLPRPTAANFARFISFYFRVLSELTTDVIEGLDELRWPHGPGAVIIEHCPGSDSIPATPRDANPSPQKEQFVEEHFIIAIGLMLGRPVAFLLEKAGELIADVVPVRGSEYRISNEGSKAELALHVELVHYLSLCPSFSILYCLRPEPKNRAVTVIVDIRDIVSRLSPECLVELRKPQFQIELPASFAITDGEKLSAPTPLISGPDDCPQIFAEFNSTVPLNSKAAEALEQVREVCETSGITHDLKLEAPGTLLAWSNYRLLHGRRPFAPDWTCSSQRWLLRMNVVPDYWPYRHVMPASQAVITTAFIPQL